MVPSAEADMHHERLLYLAMEYANLGHTDDLAEAGGKGVNGPRSGTVGTDVAGQQQGRKRRIDERLVVIGDDLDLAPCWLRRPSRPGLWTRSPSAP